MPKRSRKAILVAFGRRVRALRERKGLSQEKLGFRSGLHPTFIGFIERAERSVTLETMEKLAEGLKVSLAELFRGVKRGR